jgi:PEP-CTERM motif
MKIQNLGMLFKSFVAMVGIAASSSALATATWDFSACGNPSGGCAATVASGTSTTVKVTAWATSGTTSTSTFATSTLLQNGGSSGFSVKSTSESGSPNHAMDNNGRQEFIALEFSKPVTLDEVMIGWSSSDRDLTIMAPGGTAIPSLSGKTIANLASGWSLVQHVGDGDVGDVKDKAYGDSGTDYAVKINAGGVSSSWWLIAAYNAGYDNSKSMDSLFDYVKILSVSSRAPGRVPEPGSLALVGVALLGLMAGRKRFAKNAR